MLTVNVFETLKPCRHGHGSPKSLTLAGKPQSRNDVTRKLSGTARRYPLQALSSVVTV